MDANCSRYIAAAARRSNTYLVLVSSGRCLENRVSYPRKVPYECIFCVYGAVDGTAAYSSTLDTESCGCNPNSKVWLPLAVMSVGLPRGEDGGCDSSFLSVPVCYVIPKIHPPTQYKKPYCIPFAAPVLHARTSATLKITLQRLDMSSVTRIKAYDCGGYRVWGAGL